MKFTLGIASLLGAIAYGMAIGKLWDSSLLALPHVRAAMIGFLIGAAVWVFLGRRLSFFGVFEHELTHLIFGLLMFQRPRSFYASEHKGHVTTEGSTFIDSLAPYYFPTFSYVLLAIYPLLRPSAYGVFYPILGAVTGYHLISNMTEFGFKQADIRRSGVLFSVIFILFAATLSFGFVAGFVIRGFGGGLDFLVQGWHEVRNLSAQGFYALIGLFTDSATG
jgi:hypothetical protein